MGWPDVSVRNGGKRTYGSVTGANLTTGRGCDGVRLARGTLPPPPVPGYGVGVPLNFSPMFSCNLGFIGELILLDTLLKVSNRLCKRFVVGGWYPSLPLVAETALKRFCVV